ncbi:MAG: iron-containing alcohol dehydrogenase [Clostridia bacterium]|nr:iron-containing alcohol dehydrogenase [Clostridia bacterium]MCI2000518.1 iron-containing alcohol dehydrogenase [Clostridia bacterium]MCI2014973.1 iron-containing alcohol dehydrogenase [Clostridia bacterium]
MKEISYKSEIYYFDTFNEFVEAFNINNDDVIFTRKAFMPFFNQLKTKPIFVFNDDFGKSEPTDSIIDEILEYLKNLNFKRVIAMGGGSIVDIAKILVLKDVTSTEALFKKEIPIVKEKELVIIPTTCGTGSEVSNVSVAEIRSLHTKMGLANDAMFADQAVLIPEILQSLPLKVIINSSLDALAHAVESYLSPRATTMSEMYSAEAIKTILSVYKKMAENGGDEAYKNLKELLFASCYGGISFGHAGTATAHAMAYPLGSVYHVPHGEAVNQFMMDCLKYYEKAKPNGKIKNLIKLFSDTLDIESSKDVFYEFENLFEKIVPQKQLRDYGMSKTECILFAENVIQNQQRLLKNSYVPMTKDVIEYIYDIRY